MIPWIQYCSKAESPNFAHHFVGYGYIPWSPHGGRHIMDDFGELRQALPQDHFDTEDSLNGTQWSYYSDQQYRGH